MIQAKHYPTPEKDKIPLSQKWLYSAATVALIPGMQIIDRICQIVLNICLGISPTLVGLAMAIFRIWDAFTDPLLSFPGLSTSPGPNSHLPRR